MTGEAPSIYAIAPTRFDDVGGVDSTTMVGDANRLISEIPCGLLVTGAYGEFQSVDDTERISITSAVAGIAPRLMSGASSLGTDASIRLARALLEAGADEAMVAPPLATECTPGEVLTHFGAIAEAVDGDLVIYNNPVFGTDLDPDLLARIISGSPYRAVKQGTADLRRWEKTLTLLQSPGARVLVATDLRAVGPLSMGADGMTSTNIWVFPRAISEMYGAAVDGDLPRARRIRAALAPYVRFVQEHGQPRTVKAAMVLRGYGGTANVREPFRPLDAGEVAELRVALEQADSALLSVE